MKRKMTTEGKGLDVIVNIHRCRKLKSLMIWCKVHQNKMKITFSYLQYYFLVSVSQCYCHLPLLLLLLSMYTYFGVANRAEDVSYLNKWWYLLCIVCVCVSWIVNVRASFPFISWDLFIHRLKTVDWIWSGSFPSLFDNEINHIKGFENDLWRKFGINV